MNCVSHTLVPCLLFRLFFLFVAVPFKLLPTIFWTVFVLEVVVLTAPIHCAWVSQGGRNSGFSSCVSGNYSLAWYYGDHRWPEMVMASCC